MNTHTFAANEHGLMHALLKGVSVDLSGRTVVFAGGPNWSPEGTPTTETWATCEAVAVGAGEVADYRLPVPREMEPGTYVMEVYARGEDGRIDLMPAPGEKLLLDVTNRRHDDAGGEVGGAVEARAGAVKVRAGEGSEVRFRVVDESGTRLAQDATHTIAAGVPGPPAHVTDVRESEDGNRVVEFNGETEVSLPPGKDGKGIADILQDGGTLEIVLGDDTKRAFDFSPLIAGAVEAVAEQVTDARDAAQAAAEEAGKDAYEVWLEQGNEGTREDFFAFLRGEPGPPGDISAHDRLSYDGQTLTHQAEAGQTEPLERWQDPSGNDVARIGSGGGFWASAYKDPLGGYIHQIETTASDSQILLTWDAPLAFEPDHYVVERLDGSEWVTIGTTTETTYADTGLTNNVLYEYSVRVVGRPTVADAPLSEVQFPQTLDLAAGDTFEHPGDDYYIAFTMPAGVEGDLELGDGGTSEDIYGVIVEDGDRQFTWWGAPHVGGRRAGSYKDPPTAVEGDAIRIEKSGLRFDVLVNGTNTNPGEQLDKEYNGTEGHTEVPLVVTIGLL